MLYPLQTSDQKLNEVANIHTSRLSFGWFEWRCVDFFLKASTAKITVFDIKLACRLELKWSQDKSMRNVFTWFVCVLMMWSDWGWGLGEGANFYFSWGTKIEVFWGHYQVEKAILWTLRHYSSIRPHDLEICDSWLSYHFQCEAIIRVRL